MYKVTVCDIGDADQNERTKVCEMTIATIGYAGSARNTYRARLYDPYTGEEISSCLVEHGLSEPVWSLVKACINGCEDEHERPTLKIKL